MTQIRVPTILRSLTNGEKNIEIEPVPANVGEALKTLEISYPGFIERLIEDGQLTKKANVFISETPDEGGEDVRYLGGLATATTAESCISISPAVAGGSK